MRVSIEKLRHLPHGRPGLAAGLCKSFCLGGVLLVYGISYLVGKPLTFGWIAGLGIAANLLSGPLFHQWVDWSRGEAESEQRSSEQ